MVKQKLNTKKIFILISIIFILSLLGIYLYRGIHYYLIENPINKKNGEETSSYLFDKLMISLDLNKTGNGLYFDNESNEYYFKGNVKKNYVMYSGRLWRVVSINKDKSIVLTTDENQTILSYGADSDYLNSYIYSWLNENKEVENTGIFSKSLNDVEKYLVKTTVCLDKIDSKENFTCKEKNTDNYIGLLSLTQYNQSGSVNGFLNTKSYYWLSNTTTNGNIWYVFDQGGINSVDVGAYKHYGVKPTITLKTDITIKSGIGTKEEPFQIENEKESELKHINVGTYIDYSDYLWKVINVSDESVKVILDGYIKDGENDLTKSFSSTSNVFSSTNKNNIGYYLNNDFYNSLDNKEYLVKGKFIVDNYSSGVYDYKTLYDGKVEDAYVGLGAIGEMFIQEYNNVFLINSIDSLDDLIYSINDSGILYATNYTTKLKVRPTMYFDASLLALGGIGTKTDPYKIGR